MRRLIWLPLGGFLLIAGAAIAAAAVPTIVPSAPQALEAPSAAPDSDATPAPNTDTQSDDQQSDQPPFKKLWTRGEGMLNQVLSDLVANNTINQTQADAITKALQDAVDQRQAELDQQRQALKDQWDQIQGFLDDGVITQDEVDQLPADSPFRQMFDSIAQDGQVTLDQLRQLGPGRFFGPGRGHDFGPGMGPGHMWPHSDSDSGSDNSDSSTDSSGTGTSS
jgi:hypothetical protein